MGDQVLSTWNQAAMRGYVRQWFVFPLVDKPDVGALAIHLTNCVDRLGSQYPVLTGKVILLEPKEEGRVGVRIVPGAKIPLKIIEQRDSRSFGFTYAELKARGFPAAAFVSPEYDLPSKLDEAPNGLPVLEVHARLIQDGLIICIYGHHSITDGKGINDYVQSFADITKDTTANVQPKEFHFNTDLPEVFRHDPRPGLALSGSPAEMVRQILDLCPEFCELPMPTGPTQALFPAGGTPFKDIPKTGRIFAIDLDKIKALKKRVLELPHHSAADRPPSTYTCLAALTWAHVTKARFLSPVQHAPDAQNLMDGAQKSRLLLCIDWRRRAFADVMSNSAGNTVALPFATVDTDTIWAACSEDDSKAVPALDVIMRSIEAAILSVDEEFVATRTALWRTVKDPRRIGIELDPRHPADFCFNTWRHFTADTRWNFPGLIDEEGHADGARPDAIRRVQGDWNMGAALLLPGRSDSTKYELLVTLDTDSMAFLCAEPGWRSWVERIVE